MFTGLIRECAEVLSYANCRLRLHAMYVPKIGDSIAINGVCLTVVHLFEGGFELELSLETRALIAVEHLQGRVHMEPALALGERLDGHMVQGHVDCLGVVDAIYRHENGVDMHLSLPKAYRHLVIPKGSIAIDGVSLTINSVEDEHFRLTIIPHTFAHTLFGEYRVGRRVNIETDLFARYLYHMFHKQKSLDWPMVDRILASY